MKPVPTADQTATSQQETIAFLMASESHGAQRGPVELHETHGALIFLVGDVTYKIKKAVKFPYMDFSTLEKRRDICRHEYAINQPQAPEIYLEVVAVTQEEDGTLAFNGNGIAVEWAIKMKRFDQDRILENLPLCHLSETGLIRNLARTISDFHRTARKITTSDGVKRVALLIDELMESFDRSQTVLGKEEVSKFSSLARHQLKLASAILTSRGEEGFVRRCHGDLHLGNIVLLEDKPVLFDALEFDEELAITDTLYDLAFLMMDLDQKGLPDVANTVLNRYLFQTGAVEDLEGLRAMPLFLAIRAGVRAMVSLDRAGQTSGALAQQEIQMARRYFSSALSYLIPPKPVLIAVGGFSGTGKTTLAERLAGTCFPHAPGLVHLRSDLERKRLFNRAETERLDQAGYTADANKQVYDRLISKARICLESWQSVIIDAVFSKQWERQLAEDLAGDLDVPFQGLWLTAEESKMTSRVTMRKGDASDATAAIVLQQLKAGAGTIGWQEIDAGGSKEQTVKNTFSVLNCPGIDTNQ